MTRTRWYMFIGLLLIVWYEVSLGFLLSSSFRSPPVINAATAKSPIWKRTTDSGPSTADISILINSTAKSNIGSVVGVLDRFLTNEVHSRCRDGEVVARLHLLQVLLDKSLVDHALVLATHLLYQFRQLPARLFDKLAAALVNASKLNEALFVVDLGISARQPMSSHTFRPFFASSSVDFSQFVAIVTRMEAARVQVDASMVRSAIAANPLDVPRALLLQNYAAMQGMEIVRDQSSAADGSG